MIVGVHALNANHIKRKGQYPNKMIRQDKNLRNASNLIALFEQQQCQVVVIYDDLLRI